MTWGSKRETGGTRWAETNKQQTNKHIEGEQRGICLDTSINMKKQQRLKTVEIKGSVWPGQYGWAVKFQKANWCGAQSVSRPWTQVTLNSIDRNFGYH